MAPRINTADDLVSLTDGLVVSALEAGLDAEEIVDVLQAQADDVPQRADYLTGGDY